MSRIEGKCRKAPEMGLPETLFTQFRHRKAPSIFLSAVSGLSSLFCPAGILPQDRVTTAQSAPKIEIPFQLSNNNLMIVKVTVAGQRNVNMIVDTGTNPSLITKTLADKLRLPRDPAAIKTLNGTIRTESVVLPAFDFGPLHSVALRVMVQGLSFLEQDLGISLGGIIGLDILINGSFTIDYGKKSIAFGAVPAELKTVPFAATAPSPDRPGKDRWAEGPLAARLWHPGRAALSQPPDGNADNVAS